MMIIVGVHVMKIENISVFGFNPMNKNTLSIAKILSGKYALEILDYIYKNTNASTKELCTAITGTSYKTGNKIHYVMRNLREAGLIKKDAVNIVNIAHDDWCDFLEDEPKECNCNPDISSEVLNEE